MMARRTRKPKISLKSLVIVITRRAIIPPIILSQKTSCSLSNLHVGDYYLKGLIEDALHLIPGLVPRILAQS